MTQQHWTYAEVTAAAEGKIARLLEQANRAATKEAANAPMQWAWGVYLGWRALTHSGRHDSEQDSARLMSLFEPTA